MNVKIKALVAALVFAGSISAASAAGVITDVTINDGAGGTFDLTNLGTDPNVLDLSKAFSSLAPITLTFTVGHTNGGGGNPYVVTETITNNTNVHLGGLSLRHHGTNNRGSRSRIYQFQQFHPDWLYARLSAFERPPQS